MLANEAYPSDIKICIPILLNLYTKSKSKQSIHVCDKVIEIMYNMAIHGSTGSSDFVKVRDGILRNYFELICYLGPFPTGCRTKPRNTAL